MSTDVRIKERRLAKGLTQEELAEKVGLQKSTIAKYESGRIENIKRSVLAKLADALESSPVYLMGLESETPKLNSDDAILLKKIKRLTPDDKSVVVSLIDRLISSYGNDLNE